MVKLRLLDRKKLIRKDVEIIPIQPNLELEVYWKTLDIGKGPAVILKAFDKMILKFDCFGKGRGHFHAAPEYSNRIFFKEETVSTQIERTAKELNENAQEYLRNQPEAKIRTIEIDQEKFTEAVDRAKNKMIHFLETIPVLEDIR